MHESLNNCRQSHPLFRKREETQNKSVAKTLINVPQHIARKTPDVMHETRARKTKNSKKPDPCGWERRVARKGKARVQTAKAAKLSKVIESRMEQIPRPLTESEEFLPLLCATHVLPPISLTAAAAPVFTTDGKCCSLRLWSVESGGWTSVVTLVFVAAASSSNC